ncbi:MAG: D-alanyl-D-alanine carboxypeptidase family protein [Firmicutes bacterium]|nr:D-alanyl-D-alanine carboxypeptidase family protein [Bacillota bacterium]
MNYTILINKEKPLDSSYVPKRLVFYSEYNGKKIDPNYNTLLNKKVLSAFRKMQRKAIIDGKREGYSQGFYIIIDSAYRSYEYQKKIFEKTLEERGDEAYGYVAVPGTSEHQSGLAIDVALYCDGIYTDVFDDSYPEIRWLHKNAFRFGFILRYPKDCEEITGYKYECWHLRYVSPKVSRYMHRNNIKTLEEYHYLTHRGQKPKIRFKDQNN